MMRKNNTTSDTHDGQNYHHVHHGNKEVGGGEQEKSEQQQQQQLHVVCSSPPPPTQVWIGRIGFVVVLILEATLLGYLSYRLLNKSEVHLSEKQFSSLAERALVEAQGIAYRRRYAVQHMAELAGNLFPNKHDWPNVLIPGFQQITGSLKKASTSFNMRFYPFIYPEIHNLTQFEEFAYRHFEEMGFPNGTGMSPEFGKGIYSKNTTTGERYHDTTAQTYYPDGTPSPYKVLIPVYQADDGAAPSLMANTHFGGRAMAQDVQFKCVEKVRAYEITHEGISPQNASSCGTVTPIVMSIVYGVPVAIFGMFIFPVNDPTVVVGGMSTNLNFDEVLKNVFGDQVSGVDAVISSSIGQYETFTINKGIATYVGKGDFHDHDYDRFVKEANLTNPEGMAQPCTVHMLSLYPNRNFHKTYETSNSIMAAVGAVIIVLVTSVVFYLYDVSVRHDIRDKQEIIKARRQFVRYISHEVRTPLNSVCMGLSIALSEIAESVGYHFRTCCQLQEDMETLEAAGLPSQKRQVFTWLKTMCEIQANTWAAVNVLSDMLNYDKIERGELKLELEVVNPWELIQDTAREFKLPALGKIKFFEISFSVDEEDPTDRTSNFLQLPEDVRRLSLIGDPVRLTQVLRNLISNAIKFTPQEGSVRVNAVCKTPKPTIALSRGPNEAIVGYDDIDNKPEQTMELQDHVTVTARPKGYLILKVEDTGAGMSREQLASVAKDGVQFNANKLQAGQGTGLGLFIALGIVEQHHGTLVVTSEGLGKGTTFTVKLPLWDVSNVTQDGKKRSIGKKTLVGSGSIDGSPSSAKVAPAGAEGVVSLRVLVVDDVLPNRKLLCRLLERQGHVCDQADNGLVAVDMVRQAIENGTYYDTILMDSEMPILDGPTATKQIRCMAPPMSDVLIVGLTGNVMPEDIEFFKSAGVDDLRKPLNLSDLKQIWMEHGLGGCNRDRAGNPPAA